MLFGYDLSVYREYGITYPIKLSLTDYCHLLLVGGSGSGKSYALLFMLGQLLQSNPDIDITFCDFKNSEDFRFLNEYSKYYTGDDCYTGLENYYNDFTSSRKKGQADEKHILIFDEYPAFVSYLTTKDKANKTKYANNVLSWVSEILMLGRGLGYYIWVVNQRASSSLYPDGARDNFMVVIGLGNLSKEQKQMLFYGEDLPNTRYQRGEGIILADGKELQEIKIPKLKSLENWNNNILKVLSERSNTEGVGVGAKAIDG